MESLGVSSIQTLQALSNLLSTKEEEDEDEECQVRYCPVPHISSSLHMLCL